MKLKKRIILIMVILLLFCVGITYSIFNSNASLNVNDQGIAKFIFNAEETNNLELLLTDLNPGDKQDYMFSVSNSENGKISQVNIEYQITIKTYHFIPFKIILYKVNDDKSDYIFECHEGLTYNEQNELICNSPIQNMEYKLGALDNFKLEVIFPDEYDGAEYSGLVDFISLEINSWQKID